MLPHGRDLRLAFTVRAAIRTPRVSGTGDAHCISRGFTLLSNCVVQRMRVWSLPALLFLSEPVCRSVGRRPEARALGGKATRPHPLRHPSRRISLGSRRSSARCARTFFWEAYLSIKVPLTRLDPVHPIDAEPPQPLKEISSWFDRGPRPGAIRTATM